MAYRLATPPSGREVLTPSAPKHGSFEDNWHSSSPTRKSARVLSQRAQRDATSATPSQLPSHNLRDHQSSPTLALQRGATGSSDNVRSLGLTATKKRAARSSLAEDIRRVSGALSEESTKSAAAALQLSPAKGDGRMASQLPVPTEHRKSMLPTPVKTPKKSAEKPPAELASISRTLFGVRPDSVDEAFPTPRRGRGKYSNVLDVEEEAPIKIYTDSKERVPELDMDPENAFLVHQNSVVPDPVKKPKVITMVKIPGEGEITLEEAVKRDDGIVYML
jgi:hypothetical protein